MEINQALTNHQKVPSTGHVSLHFLGWDAICLLGFCYFLAADLPGFQGSQGSIAVSSATAGGWLPQWFTLTPRTS